MIICKYVVIFFFYSMLGFIYESIYSSIKKHEWQNRGFFYGPIIPIYGVGACIGTLLFYDLNIPFLAEKNVIVIFLVGYFGSIILEYSTGYALEKIFHAIWWDYSGKFLNIKGRICLSASIGFGIGAIVIVKWLIPWVEGIVAYFPDALMVSLSLIFIFIFGFDFALTISALSNFQHNFNRLEAQYTERMSKFYDNIESSVVSRINGAKRGLEKSKDKFSSKTVSLSSKLKRYNEEADLMLEQEIDSMIEATPDFEKSALSRIREFKTEGKRKKISDIFKRKLKRSNE